jgi:hypothetical protein
MYTTYTKDQRQRSGEVLVDGPREGDGGRGLFLGADTSAPPSWGVARCVRGLSADCSCLVGFGQPTVASVVPDSTRSA